MSPLTARYGPCPESGCGHRGQNGRPSLAKQVASARKRNPLVALGHNAEVLALLLEGRAATCRRHETPEAAHGVVSLLDAPVVLFDPVIFVATGAMDDGVAEGLAEGARVRTVPVGRHLRGRASGEIERLAEEPLCRVHVPCRAQPRIDQIPLAVDRAIQIAPVAIDPDRGLIRVPLGAYRATPSGAQPCGDQWGKSASPSPAPSRA